jgi:inner membrane protein
MTNLIRQENTIMPTAIAHMAAGPALASVLHPQKKGFLLFMAVLFCSILPDLDVIAFGMGIPYGHTFGHRGLSHSLVFAACTGFFMAALIYLTDRRGIFYYLQLFLIFTTVTALHGVLDAMTSGGLGVGFFIPFDHSRYFFPWRPIRVSPIGLEAFISERGLNVIKSELIWVIAPSLALIMFIYLLKKIFLRLSAAFRAN